MKRAAMSWSSGKDSAFALHAARQQGEVEIVALLSTVNEMHERVAIHGVRRAVLRAQAAALELDLIEVPLPFPCSNDVYEARMAEALGRLEAMGIRDHVFGDLFLEDIRAYREGVLEPRGLAAHFPLWKIETHRLARDMLACGIRAYVATLDPKVMPKELCGAAFDEDFMARLPKGVDPCGENGEFHTVVADAPGFAAPLDLVRGETVERDGFVYTDFVLSQPADASDAPQSAA